MTTNRLEVTGAKGVVATPTQVATQAGMQMYALGGNAIDAAVAANAALTVVQCYQCGIGGDLFAIVRPAGGEPVVVNGSGRTPAGLTRDKVLEAGHDRVPFQGGLAVSVPGAVMGWQDMVERWGRLDFDRVLEPARALAADGWVLADAMPQTILDKKAQIEGDPNVEAEYFPVNGAPVPGGTVGQMPNLAGTLAALQKDGAAAFYTGAIAEKMIAAVQARGGVLAESDLANHATLYQEPLVLDYRGQTILQCPPNSQGLASIVQLALLRAGDVGSLGHLTPDSIDRLVGATRIALAERDSRVADPETSDIADLDALIAGWEESARAAPPSASPLPNADTVYVATADRDGNVVSLLESLYVPFGSGVMAGDTGVFVHNRAAFMPTDPDHPNCVGPGKLPRHTLMPGMILDGDNAVALGARGADGQPQTMAQMITGRIDYGLGLQEMLEAPRWLYGGILPTDPKDELHLEARMPADTVEALEKRGYKIDRIGPWSGVVGVSEAAAYDASGVLTAASDPRSDGSAAGW